ncbi:YrvL family regulatory protein [Bacillus gobiensis]|uniref:YrvL family regulatory protein n=1 Tax=Bacillus gobiensis TaxID=1441095 RepID=UPI003D1CCB78
MKEKEPSFKEMEIGEKLIVIGGIGIIIIVSLAILAGVTFFGITGVFRIFGVTYDSYTSILLFILFTYLVGIPTELILGKALILVIKSYISLPESLITFLVECFCNWMVFSIVDSFMTSIDIPLEIELL